MGLRFPAWLALLVGSAAVGAAVPQVPEITIDADKDPAVDDIRPSAELGLPMGQEGRSIVAKLGRRKRDLFLAIRMARTLKDSEEIRLGLRFVNATGGGRRLVFGTRGLSGPSPSLSNFVSGGVKNSRSAFSAKARIAAKGLPRFPAKGPLLLEICAEIEPPGRLLDPNQSCREGQAFVTVRIPDVFRSGLELKLDDRVIAVEGRAKGWIGYPALVLPIWMQGDAALEATTVHELATGESKPPETLQIPLPKRMTAPDGRALVPVFTGSDPTAADGRCDSDRELRLGLYAVKGLNAVRALEWPAVNCVLGRAVTVVLDEDGDLSIGYSNGPTASFVWSADHFERTEIGIR